MKLFIKNIQQLLQVEETPKKWVAGAEMQKLPAIENAWLAIENGKIAAFGKMNDWPGIVDWRNLKVIDATGKMVLPAWCDSHTHTVHAASREKEFEMRIKGKTYEEIAMAGGGILNSAHKLREMPEEQLLADAQLRIDEMIAYGTGALEIKSGYGLTMEAEIKMLRVIKKLAEQNPIPIKATFLGAHAIPAEYRHNRNAYLDLVVNEMLPRVAEEQLAQYIDVFCESNYFTVAETKRIMKAGAAFGLRPKIHVNQFTAMGGVQAGVQHHALSVDHLEEMREEDVRVLMGTSTMPTLLPSCSFFLGIPFGPARKLIEAGLPLALATDFNPGSTPSGNMQFVLSLACIKMKMTPAEAIHAATLNGAYAMDLGHDYGSIAPGKTANLIITRPMESFAYIPYAFGSNGVDQMIINGKVHG